jgi:PAS domain S-box-containing protein
MPLSNDIATIAETIFNFAPIGIYTVNLDGRIETANPEFLKISGEAPKDIIGLDTLNYQSYKDSGLNIFIRDGLAGKPFETEVRHVSTIAHKESWRHYHGVPIFAEDGTTVLRLLLLFEDITERKNLELKLAEHTKTLEREVEERTALVSATLDSIDEAVMVVGDDDAIMTRNKHFNEYWRIPQELSAEKDHYKLLDFVRTQVEDPDAFVAHTKQIYGKPDAEGRDEIRFIDGRVFERYTQPLNSPEHGILGRVWTYRNVTDRRKTERQLEDHAKELERLNELMVNRELKMAELKKEIAQLKGTDRAT